jgi:hypothetical protein
MKSLGTLLFLALIAFYVAWPAYSAYEIRNGLEKKDPTLLEAKIDFTRLRASLRPAVSVAVEKAMKAALKKAGPAGGQLTDELRAKLMPRVVDAALAVLVTPETLIRIHAEGTDLKKVIDGIVAQSAAQPGGIGDLIVVDPATGKSDALGTLGKIAEQFGIDPKAVLGGLKGNDTPEEAGTTEQSVVSEHKVALGYGFDNIKSLGLDGPLGLELGVARDPKSRQADLTAQMSFVDGDWKLTGLVPRI